MSLVGKGERFEDGAFYIHYYMKNGKGTLNKKGYESIKDLERQLEEAREAIGNVLNITYDSEGVAGYHNNGDVALWSEFEEIQQLEEQLKEKGE